MKLNIFSKKEKEIKRLDNKIEYKEIAYSIRNKFPNNPMKQIEEWEKQPAQYRVMGIAGVAQEFLIHQQHESIQVSAGQLDLLYRAIVDLSCHLQEDLPDGVHDYSYHNVQGVTKYLIREIPNKDQD